MKAWRVEARQGPAGQAVFGIWAERKKVRYIGLQQRGGPEPRRAGSAPEAMCPEEPGV